MNGSQMKTVRVIPPKPEFSGENRINLRPKRVAAYCRVSTDREEQEHSFETQKEMYTELIMMKPTWQMAGMEYHKGEYSTGKELVFMSKHLNPLEKEFLIRQYKSNTRIKMRDFCEANHISTGAFQKWIKQYDEGGLEGLARADSEIKDVLPEGIDRTEESYKREILKLRIENERLKKNYVVQTTDTGEQEFIRLRPKNSKS